MIWRNKDNTGRHDPPPVIPDDLCPLITGCDPSYPEDMLREFVSDAADIACTDVLDPQLCDPAVWEAMLGIPDWLSLYAGSFLMPDIASMLNAIGVQFQDWALGVDMYAAAGEVWLIATGCFAGVPIGCLGGVVVSDAIFVASGLNSLETGLSTASLVFTGLSDLVYDNNHGEDSATSAATWLLGLASPDPILDFAFDGYASGYNHGVFCGAYTFSLSNWYCGP